MTGYQSGFGNEFATEAIAGALPVGRNSPQRAPLGLYAEQFSGTAFTAPRATNRRSWLYRIRPAAMHGEFSRADSKRIVGRFDNLPVAPNQLRWDPPAFPAVPTDFIDGMTTYAGNGDPAQQSGCGIHLYVANASMADRYFANVDAEMLVIPQVGRLRIATELGIIDVEPLQIAVLPRGLRFRVELLDDAARGYICENFGQHFRLPELGPIGANGLANARDFESPVAAFEDRSGDFELVVKFGGEPWAARIDHSPLDVVAWHGNYAPYRYDLRRFNTIGSVSFDHPDPSIYSVLSAPSDTPGVNDVDFVIFPPRWLVMQDTFRPPWFHRNIASEFMGLIAGTYDAKSEGFAPGGASLHNSMSGHGPDAATFEHASIAATDVPAYIGETMAFMFETRLVIRPTTFAMETPDRQRDYTECWSDLPATFGTARARA